MQKPFEKGETQGEKIETPTKVQDIRTPQLETCVRGLEAAIREKDSHIQYIESVLKEKETALNNIYKSRGWKALLIFYKLIEKIFPMNTKRRLIARVIFKAITEPGRSLRLNITNLKNFSTGLEVEPRLLEKEIEKKISELSNVNEVGQGVEKFNKPYPILQNRLSQSHAGSVSCNRSEMVRRSHSEHRTADYRQC